MRDDDGDVMVMMKVMRVGARWVTGRQMAHGAWKPLLISDGTWAGVDLAPVLLYLVMANFDGDEF